MRVNAVATVLRCGAHALDLSRPAVMGIVNDDVITKGEFDSRLRALRADLARARSGNEQNAPMPPEDVLREQLMERLIVESLQLQLGQRMGVEISDEQVWAAVQQIAQSNGITVEQLQQNLKSDGISLRSFLSDLSRQIGVAAGSGCAGEQPCKSVTG